MGFPEKKWKGRLSFDEDKGARLSLLTGEVGKSTDVFIDQDHEEYDVIVGQAVGGGLISLAKCFDLGRRGGMEGPYHKDLFARYVLTGAAVNSPDPIVNTLVATFDNLYRWEDHQTIEVHHAEGHREVTITWKGRDSINLYSDDDMSLSLDFILSDYPVKSWGKMHVGMSEEVQLRIEYARGKELSKCLDDVYMLQEFFSIGIQRLCSIDSIALGLPKDQLSIPPDVSVNNLEWCFYHSFPRATVKHQNPPDVFGALFTLKSIEDRVTQVFGKWLNLAKEIRQVLLLYYSATYNSHAIEVQFLNYVQAIEAFHRTRRKGYYIDRKKFESSVLPKLEESIPRGISDELRSSIKNRIAYSYQYSLRDRIQNIFDEFPGIVYATKIDANKYSQRIAKIRNDLVHRQSNKPLDEHGFDELTRASLLLRIFLELSLVKESGIDIMDILKFGVHKGSHYSLIDDFNRMNPNIRSKHKHN